MELHAIIATSDTELLFLHECSPVSPVTLTNFASFNLLNHTTPTCSPPFTHVTTPNAEFTILHGDVNFIFCHATAATPVIFCHKVKELFTATFKSITRDTVNQQSVTNNIDLCLDLLRRIIQFGRIHEVDLDRLIQSTLFNQKNSSPPPPSTLTSSLLSKMFEKKIDSDNNLPEVCCTIRESLTAKILNGKIILSKCTGLIEVSLSQNTANINLVQLELAVPESVFLHAHRQTRQTTNNQLTRFERAVSSQATGLEICRYEVKLSKKLQVVPIEVSTSLNTWKKDKLAELIFNVKTNFDKPFRATHVVIEFATPPEMVNAKLTSDNPTQVLDTSRKDALVLRISNLFGQSSSQASVTLSLTSVDCLKDAFKTIQLSFRIDHLATLSVDKFKLLDVKRRTIAATRLQRVFSSSDATTHFIIN